MRKVILSILLTICCVTFAQDIIITKDSERIDAKIEMVSPAEIRYKKLSNLNGPTFVMPTENISAIMYENGEVQTFSNEEGKKEKKVVSKLQNNKDVNITVYAEASGTIGQETGFTPIIGGPEIHFIFGSKFSNVVFVGGGVGINLAFGNYKKYNGDRVDIRTFQLPIFVNTRVFIPIQSNTFRPLAEISIGPLFELKSDSGSSNHSGDVSAFFRIGIGGEYKRFVFGAGYELWGNRNECDNYGYFKIGVRMGK